MKKNILLNTIGSTTYALTSLFFLMIVTRINGVDAAGVFTFGFSFACLIVCVGNYATRTFHVTENNDAIVDAHFVHHKIIMCVVMLMLALGYCMVMHYSMNELIIIMLLVFYKVLETFSEVIYGVFQKNDQLYKVGTSYFLKASLGIIIFLTTNLITRNLILAIIALILITLFVILFYDSIQFKKCIYTKSEFSWETMMKITKSGFNPFLFTFLSLYVINASRYTIEFFLPNAEQTYYGILIMPATVVTMIGQYATQPFVVQINEAFKKCEYSLIVNVMKKLAFIIVMFGLASVIGASLIGVEVLSLLYSVDVSAYRLDLLFILLGATCLAISSLISIVLITLRENWIQTKIYLVVGVITFITSIFMVQKYKVFGATITYLISMLLILIGYMIVFMIIKRNWKTTD